MVFYLVSNAGARELKEMVITGSRLVSDFSENTRDVTVITSEQIMESGADSVSGVLDVVAGIDVQERGEPGVQSDITLRGSTFQQVLLLVDGIRVNDSQTAHHNMDLTVDLDDIERIEILRGHGSSLYGGDAFGGVINIITREPEGERIKFCVNGGQFNTLGGSLNYAKKFKGFAQSIAVSRNVSDGFMEGTEYDILNAGGMTSFLFAETAKLKLNLGLSDKEFGAYDFYTPGWGMPSQETTRTRFGGLSALMQLKGVTLEPKIYYRSHYDKFILDRTFLTYNSINEHNTYQYGFEVNARNENVSAGVEIFRETIDGNSLGSHSRNRGAVFCEFNKSVKEAWNVNAGARLDNSVWGWDLSPTVGVGVTCSPELKLRVSGGKAFRVPSYTELYYNSPGNLGYAGLKPEEMTSLEAGFDYRSKKNLLAKFTLFDRIEYNLIDWTRQLSSEPWQVKNIGRGNMLGLEACLEKKWQNASAAVLYSYCRLLEERDYLSKYALRYPLHHITINMSANIFLGAKGVLQVVYKKRTDGGYYIMNVLCEKKLKNAGIFIRLDNIFNRVYEDVLGVRAPGRWLKAGVKVGNVR